MSCHDIGRGMNSVVDVVNKLLDSEKIDSDAEGNHNCSLHKRC